MALSAEDRRALAVEVGMPEVHSRQPLSLVDALIGKYHNALLDRIELRINEAAKDVPG